MLRTLRSALLAAVLGLAAAFWLFSSAPTPDDAPRAASAHAARPERATGARRAADSRASIETSALVDETPEAKRAPRENIMDAAYDLLDTLDAQVGLSEAQYERLAEILEQERASGFATIDAARPRPGHPPRPPEAVRQEMQAHRDQADEAARVVLTSAQVAAWDRLRAPAVDLAVIRRQTSR